MPPPELPIYVTGGSQKARKTDEWRQYAQALILRVDPGSGEVATEVRYVSDPGTFPAEDPCFIFKAGSVAGDRLYACTQTEVLIYEIPGFRQVGHVSLPFFNDLHHVTPTPEGNLLVAVTGLDMIAEVDTEGRVLREWGSLGESPWQKFSKQIDYRKIPTTKPHLSHPNFAFRVGDDVWCSRFHQQDAVCLTRPGASIELGSSPHDGIVHEGRIWFTTVDSRIFIVDAATQRIEEELKLFEFHEEDLDLGWCRGVMPLNEHLFWVGFSRLRPTKFRENLSFVRHGFKQVYQPTRIALYDRRERRMLREIDLEPYALNAVFSILPAPAGTLGG